MHRNWFLEKTITGQIAQRAYLLQILAMIQRWNDELSVLGFTLWKSTTLGYELTAFHYLGKIKMVGNRQSSHQSMIMYNRARQYFQFTLLTSHTSYPL